MSIEFFKLPAALKKAIWAAYLAERCRWAWSALAPFPLSAFQRHGWRWQCSIRAGFGRLPEGSDSPPNGSEKQV